jgi:hypothetical protein
MSMDYANVLEALKRGHRVSRGGWPRGDYVVLATGGTFNIEGQPMGNLAPFCVRHRDGKFYVWQPTNYDQLSEDWVATPFAEYVDAQAASA